MSLRGLSKKIFRRLGYELIPRSRIGVKAYLDIGRICDAGTAARPVCFDVGANVGQTVRKLRKVLPDSVIHSFEPAPEVFSQLSAAHASTADVHLVNAGLGRTAEKRDLLEHGDSRLNSYLEPGADGWDTVSERRETQILTIDGYCADHSIDGIDVLKIDTQGFELEVLGGASRMLAEARIGLVYLELNCGDIYRDVPPIDEVLRFLREQEFDLVSLYRFYRRDIRALWTDGLFLHRARPS